MSSCLSSMEHKSVNHFPCCVGFYAPTVRVLSIHPEIFNFVTKVEKLGHPCPMDIFLVYFWDFILENFLWKFDWYKQESPGSCDLQSIQSNYSNAASDASWDQMDDPEVNVTRWVPDHMVTQCAGCEMEFSMLKRKHHCRY